ncbi:MAG TPA: hypothetical protein VNB06_02275 [Thermoanaerobaculia bacterium]|nr:hypothetical protein [Thermoanaerobaculia bacterium]
MNRPTTPTLLEGLSKDRLVELGRRFEVALCAADTEADQIRALQRASRLSFASLLEVLGGDELRAACRRHDLPLQRSETGRVQRPESDVQPRVDQALGQFGWTTTKTWNREQPGVLRVQNAESAR